MTYTVNQAAAVLDISPQRVRQLTPANAKRIGGMIILTSAQLTKMARRNLKPGPPRKGAKK